MFRILLSFFLKYSSFSSQDREKMKKSLRKIVYKKLKMKDNDHIFLTFEEGPKRDLAVTKILHILFTFFFHYPIFCFFLLSCAYKYQKSIKAKDLRSIGIKFSKKMKKLKISFVTLLLLIFSSKLILFFSSRHLVINLFKQYKITFASKKYKQYIFVIRVGKISQSNTYFKIKLKLSVF